MVMVAPHTLNPPEQVVVVMQLCKLGQFEQAIDYMIECEWNVRLEDLHPSHRQLLRRHLVALVKWCIMVSRLRQAEYMIIWFEIAESELLKDGLLFFDFEALSLLDAPLRQ